MTAPVVSVVVPSRNAAATLGQQLAALGKQELKTPWEIVVVDNGSTDETRDLLARWQTLLPNLRVVSCVEVGLNRARNAGVWASRASRIAICDADDVVAPSWLAALVEALDEFDIVAGSLDTSRVNTELLRSTRDLPTEHGLPKVWWHLPYAVGGNMAFRRAVFDAVDGFDDEALGGADEVDFCWRAQYAGFSIGYEPAAVVYYRFRPNLRAALRQSYSWPQGHAQLRAKHTALGRLPSQSPRQSVSLAKKHMESLLLVRRLGSRSGRWRYAQDAARLAGALAGYRRFRVMT